MSDPRTTSASPFLRAGVAIPLLAALSLLGCGPAPPVARVIYESPPPLGFATLPFLERETLERALAPLAEYLSHGLGRRVEVRTAANYGDLIRMRRQARVDIGWFAPRARDHEVDLREMIPICRPVPKGDSKYRGLIVAARRSGCRTLAQLRGRSFAYVDPHSNSGFIQPNRLLLASGIDPERFFGRIGFAGSHDRAVDGVLRGSYDAAAVMDRLFREPSRAQQLANDLTVLASTDPMEPDPIVAAPGLPVEIRDRLRDLLVGARGSESGRAALRQLEAVIGLEGFEALRASPPSPQPRGRS